MSFGEQMKRKADEVSLDAKAKDFGEALAELAKTAVGLVTSAAKDNQGKIEGAIDKAATRIDETTGGKHTETIAKVKDQATTGFAKLVEQGDKVGTPAASVPGADLADGSDIPADTHSAWVEVTDDDATDNTTDDATDHTSDDNAPGHPS